MMASDFGNLTYERGYSTVESLLDEAATNLRLYSRGSSSGHRTAGSMGGSMRIVKPNSASNSPRGSIGLGRRKTVMSDRQHVPAALRVPAKSGRPVSWHPSSQFAPQQTYQSLYPVTNARDDLHLFELPPTPVVYSGYGSPDSSFSPELPYNGHSPQHYMETGPSVPLASSCHYVSSQQQNGTHQPAGYFPVPAVDTPPTLYSHFDFGIYATNDFETSTSPPTPDDFLPIQYPDSSFPAEEAIPYHSLSNSTDEEDGEILCGMGLYDAPETSKAAPSDPQLDNYRSSLSQLLGSGHRREPTGKGLKLEETWNPPASDDEEEEDEDGEGEDDDEADYNKGAAAPAQRLSTDFEARNRDRISWL